MPRPPHCCAACCPQRRPGAASCYSLTTSRSTRPARVMWRSPISRFPTPSGRIEFASEEAAPTVGRRSGARTTQPLDEGHESHLASALPAAAARRARHATGSTRSSATSTGCGTSSGRIGSTCTRRTRRPRGLAEGDEAAVWNDRGRITPARAARRRAPARCRARAGRPMSRRRSRRQRADRRRRDGHESRRDVLRVPGRSGVRRRGRPSSGARPAARGSRPAAASRVTRPAAASRQPPAASRKPRAESPGPRVGTKPRRVATARRVRAGPWPLRRLRGVRPGVPPRERLVVRQPVATCAAAEPQAAAGRADVLPVGGVPSLRAAGVSRGLPVARVRATSGRRGDPSRGAVHRLPLLRDGLPVRRAEVRRVRGRDDEVRLLPARER